MTNPYQPPEWDFPDDETNYHDLHEGPDYDEAREYWPTCPECYKRLTITCPFCKTTDDLFPLGDTEHWDDDLGGSLVEYQRRLDRKVASRSVLFGEGDTSMPLGEHGCSCQKTGKTPAELYGGTRPELTGQHRCDAGNTRRESSCDCNPIEDDSDEYDDEHDDALNDDDYDELFNGDFDNEDIGEDDFDDGNEDGDNDNGDEDLPEREYDSESLPFVVICPTCSEAFIPSFPGGCRHCRYVWDRSKPLDAEHAVEAHLRTHRKVANPALREPDAISRKQLLVIAVIVVAVLMVMALLIARG